MNIKNISRLEVIWSERLLVKYNIEIVDISLQDNWMTMKIFIKDIDK